MTTSALPPLRDVIRRLGLTARKSFGQNFILDLNLTRRIARAAGSLEDVTVVEVGPGPGGLTRALLDEGAAKVVAIERDPRFVPALEEIALHWPGRLQIVSGDALHVDFMGFALGRPTRLVANLPYGVATALLVRWLGTEPWPPWFDKAVLMFQREVAERIVAKPGGKAYGRLSVLSQWRTRAKILLTLPPQAFTPPPKVDSSLVELVPRPSPDPPCRIEDLGRVTAAAFGQRRKMLRASLRQIHPNPEHLLAEVGIISSQRAEQLSVEEFGKLALVLSDRGPRGRRDAARKPES